METRNKTPQGMRQGLRLVLVLVSLLWVGGGLSNGRAYAQNSPCDGFTTKGELPIKGCKHYSYANGQHQVTVKMTLSAGGGLEGTMVLENKSMKGFCAGSIVTVTDKEGNILDAKAIPEYCLDGNLKETPIQRTVPIKSELSKGQLEKAYQVGVQVTEGATPLSAM